MWFKIYNGLYFIKHIKNNIMVIKYLQNDMWKLIFQYAINNY